MSDGFGKYDVYATAGSLYCYPDSNVLRNRLGIRDSKQLKRLEADITAIRQNHMLSDPIPGHLTANHLCRIHRYLFGDLYSFAGHYRREDIMKGRTRFLAHSEIPVKLKTLLEGLKSENHLQGVAFDAIIDRSAYYFAELNYIHPFREGNGRTTREFMRLLYLQDGYAVKWNAVGHERFLQVMEDSVFDVEPLKAVLRECLKPLK